jgi:hypothetical protein
MVRVKALLLKTKKMKKTLVWDWRGDKCFFTPLYLYLLDL